MCALLVTAVLAGCSGSSPTTPTPPATPSPSASASASASPDTHAATADAMGDALAPVSGAGSSPTDAALKLQALLGQHSILVADMMRARIRGDADVADAADAALRQNSASLGGVLTPVVGPTAAATFARLWANHIQGFFTYSRGLAEENPALRASSTKQLQLAEAELANFFVAGSQGRLPRAAALAAVTDHIQHLLQGADAYAAKDYAKAAQLYRMCYEHTFDLGAALANALLPAQVGKQLATPQLQLRSALTKLLGEHVGLVVAAMRSSVGDTADFSAMGDVVNGNTQALAGAIDTLFGAAAAKGFEQYWANHVDQLLAYTRATVDADAAGQEKARLALRSFEHDFAGFLSTATGGRLGQPALIQVLVMHDRELLAEIDAYAAKKYPQAHDLSYQTYQHMYTVAGLLSGAIGATLAGKLPKGGSQTGLGGTAKVVVGR